MADLIQTWLEQKIAQADASRSLGNEQFKDGQHDNAISMYDVALNYVHSALDSAESLPMNKWTKVHVAGWIHQRFGEAVATAAANADMDGTMLAMLPASANMLALNPEDLTSLLSAVGEFKNTFNPSVATALNREKAKILSNRSLAKGKLQNHHGAYEDALASVTAFPQWGKAYYRLGSCQLKLSTLGENQNTAPTKHAKMVDAARKTFQQGSELPLSEHTSQSDIITMQEKVRICSKKLQRILDMLREQLAKHDDELQGMPELGGGNDDDEEAGAGAVANSRTFNDVSILSCGLKDDAATLARKIRNGSSANSCNQMGQTALHVAAIWGAMKCGTILLDNGANVNARNQLSGGTPLMMAAQRDRAEFAALLLSRGANSMLEDNRGMFAYQFARDETLREMLGGPSSKLFDAIQENNMKEVERISCEHPELIAAENSEGDTPMAIALSEEKNFEIALYFAQHPAAMSYVNAHGSEGETPLHAACKWEEEDQGLQLLVALVKAGADVNMKSLRLDE